MDDKDLLASAEAELPSENASDYLQESGDSVTMMVHKFRTTQQKALADLKPTELSQIEARQKFQFLDQEIGGMVKRGDVGTPVIDTKTNTPLQADMDFIAEHKKIPEDLKEGMEDVNKDVI